MIGKHDFITLLSNNTAETVLKMTKDELAENFGVDFANMKDYDQQNPHHCYTLLEHTLRSVDALDTSGLPEADGIMLKAVMFFHDCGKSLCAMKKDDKLVFTGHPAKSARIAKPLLQEIGFSDKETERMCFFIEYHDIFMGMRLDASKELRTKGTVISDESVKRVLTNIRKTAVHEIKYYPTDADFLFLPVIMRADASAQAEKVIKKGVLSDSNSLKKERADEIDKCIINITGTEPDSYVCVFGASSNNIDEKYINEAFRLGVCMVKEKFGLVFGAGLHGLMGAVAEGINSAGGKAYGVIPEKLHRPGIASPYCSELFVTATMHERKAKMEDLSSAFISLPGGYGTFEELLEIITLKQLGYVDMPIVIMNIDGYYDDLLNMFEYATDEGFADEKYLSLFHESTTPEDALRYIKEYKPSEMPDKIGEVLKKTKRQ